jgi:hypothetical protein
MRAHDPHLGALTMALRMLKPSTPYLRGGLPLLQHAAPGQVVKRVDGDSMRALKKRALARSGWYCECDLCQAGYAMKLTWKTCELDHHIPLYQGGTNAIANMRALHVACHKRITAQQAAERAATGYVWSDGPAHAQPQRSSPRRSADDDMPC